MEVDGGLPAIVHLNVGGLHFTTSLATLQGERFGSETEAGGSMLSSMFSGRMPTRVDGDGRFFIDRDGRHFHHILNYLRDGKFPRLLPLAERLELEREASFYGLEALASHLRADLHVPGLFLVAADAERDYSPDGVTLGEAACAAETMAGIAIGSGAGSPSARQIVSAAEAADGVLNGCLEAWPEFPRYVRNLLSRLLAAGGVQTQETSLSDIESPSSSRAGVPIDEAIAASLQADTLAEVQIELAHVDPHSKAWRWSERRFGVNSILRAKLLRCHLQRLGFCCRIVSVLDKKEVVSYVLQVELPIPQ